MGAKELIGPLLESQLEGAGFPIIPSRVLVHQQYIVAYAKCWAGW